LKSRHGRRPPGGPARVFLLGIYVSTKMTTKTQDDKNM
jgi:hypothetical protein